MLPSTSLLRLPSPPSALSLLPSTVYLEAQLKPFFLRSLNLSECSAWGLNGLLVILWPCLVIGGREALGLLSPRPSAAEADPEGPMNGSCLLTTLPAAGLWMLPWRHIWAAHCHFHKTRKYDLELNNIHLSLSFWIACFLFFKWDRLC
jgi:hypothetical protein